MNYDNISFARTETCMIMNPEHSNVMGNVHGGELVKIMDNMAGVTALKHAKGPVVTARIDEIVFLKPIYMGNVITCVAQLAYVGKSSMQIIVEIFIHDVKNETEPEKALTAFFTMVHFVDGKPKEVPKLVVSTKEEEEIYKLGEQKYNSIRQKYQ